MKNSRVTKRVIKVGASLTFLIGLFFVHNVWADTTISVDKTMNFPTNLYLENVSGKTKISWTPGDSVNVILKYRIYTKYDNENDINFLTDVASTSFITADNWPSWADTKLRVYKVSEIFSDGTESALSTIVNDQAVGTGPAPQKYAITPSAHYKFDGQTAIQKGQDEIRSTGAVMNPTNLVSDSDRFGNTDTSYKFWNSYLQIPNLMPTLANASRTYSVWFKEGSNGGTQTLFSFFGTTGNYLRMQILNSKIYFTANANINVGVSGNTDVSLGTGWHKVDLVMQNNPGTNIKVFIDGKLDGTITNATAYNFSNLNSYAHVGANSQYVANPAYTDSNFYGSLDDLKIFGRALTDAEVLSEYNLDKPYVAPVNNPPIITLNGNDTIFTPINSQFVDPGATATDTEDGNITSKIIVTGNVDTTKIGTFKLTYSVTDSSGASTIIFRNVKVINVLDQYRTVSWFKLNGTTTDQTFKNEIIPTDNLILSSGFSVPTQIGDRYTDPNTAYKFVGSILNFPSPRNFTTTSFAVSYWLKTFNQGTQQDAVAWSSGNSDYLEIGTRVGYPYINFMYTKDGNSVSGNFSSSYSVANDKWQKVDYVFENTPNMKVSMYINGKLATVGNYTKPYDFTSLGNLFAIGGRTTFPTGATMMFGGSLDDIKIFDKALTASDTASLYSSDYNSTLQYLLSSAEGTSTVQTDIQPPDDSIVPVIVDMSATMTDPITSTTTIEQIVASTTNAIQNLATDTIQLIASTTDAVQNIATTTIQNIVSTTTEIINQATSTIQEIISTTTQVIENVVN